MVDIWGGGGGFAFFFLLSNSFSKAAFAQIPSANERWSTLFGSSEQVVAKPCLRGCHCCNPPKKRAADPGRDGRSQKHSTVAVGIAGCLDEIMAFVIPCEWRWRDRMLHLFGMDDLGWTSSFVSALGRPWAYRKHIRIDERHGCRLFKKSCISHDSQWDGHIVNYYYRLTFMVNRYIYIYIHWVVGDMESWFVKPDSFI